ncbi:DNA alkylation repair protein [Paenibacillus sp. GSMTC-2017]|uniref:DNA alkylation repair protein n=1 Tax=Paenibacillus sp. GSMTC-2017 TaxID=2794350 RepID=UPI0018D8784D|nr:DNA alkylation repair protein [Paenibacillus sp. GSMTC-2017]MBH5319433.1 DNA alkylation repair protein [Paenibacillus sp. GSMTC-2017]
MNLEAVMQELEALGKERTKKIYQSNGAQEPLFGVATGAMKPLFKKIKLNQPLADQLYATGNYDAMYFAGIIADPNVMTEADFERWIDGAYFYMLSDFVVAVTLSETNIAQEVSDKWIDSNIDLKMSAGWNCYCWLLGNRPDHEFSEEKLAGLLTRVKETIHEAPERTKYAMNQFLYTVGISYQHLHDKAIEIAQEVGPVEVNQDSAKSKFLNASLTIQNAVEKGRIGFKRKHVRC